MKYKVLEGDGIDELAERVQLHLDEGWKLCGGVSIGYAIDPDDIHYEKYVQAVTFDEPPARIVFEMSDEAAEAWKRILKETMGKKL